MASLLVPAQTTAAGSARDEVEAAARPEEAGLRAPARVWVTTGLAVVGILSVWPTVLSLWSLWTTDPLKSIGGFVPLVSLVLILRVWRSFEWQTRGSWWGLGLLFATVAAVHLRDGAVLELVLSPSWSITLPPHSLVAFAYASSVVLLVGGGRFWRASLFPVALMWFVNPVPHVFNRLVDLPLQQASAHVARGLAHGLGQRLTPDQLTLMFTPDFGMFIAPGCDGIRGALTMGFLALVAGYLYRFRPRNWALIVGGAVLLGYGFNLLRLCILVLYYVLALRWRGLQGHAEMADYCIGATLFFFAAMLLFAAIRRMGSSGDLRIPAPRVVGVRDLVPDGSHQNWYRCAAFALLVVLGAGPYVGGMLRPQRASAAETAVASAFPQDLGPYRLRRTWPEKLATGQTIFEWAEYSRPAAGYVVAVGVSPVLGAHDTLLCHAARGEDWLWHGTLTFATPGAPVSFSGSSFNDGVTQYVEATTVCSGTSCGQWSTEQRHLGFIYSRPHLGRVLGSGSGRPVPILLRAEIADATLPAGFARAQLVEHIRDFAAYAPFGTFTYRYQRP